MFDAPLVWSGDPQLSGPDFLDIDYNPPPGLGGGRRGGKMPRGQDDFDFPDDPIEPPPLKGTQMLTPGLLSRLQYWLKDGRVVVTGFRPFGGFGVNESNDTVASGFMFRVVLPFEDGRIVNNELAVADLASRSAWGKTPKAATP